MRAFHNFSSFKILKQKTNTESHAKFVFRTFLNAIRKKLFNVKYVD